MKTEIGFDGRALSLNRLHDEFEKSMNTALADFIADLLKVKGAGHYMISLHLRRAVRDVDHAVWHIEARTADGERLNFPYPPMWGMLPEWANFWTVSAIGQICWHESQPELITEQGVWASHLRMDGDKDRLVEIPLGIDWRTLCFQRPTSVIAHYKMAYEQSREALPLPDSPKWGIFDVFRKFLP